MATPDSTSSFIDRWAKAATEIIAAHSKVASLGSNHAGSIGGIREAVIRNFLREVVPSIFEIGSGQLVDSVGRRSRQIDIVISRRDVVSFALPGGTKLYPVESVVATCEVKSSLRSNTVKDALDNAFSVGELDAVLCGDVDKIAADRGLQKQDRHFVHPTDPLETARWECVGRPACYVIGLDGYGEGQSENLKRAIFAWHGSNGSTPGLMHFPVVIVTKGCVVWRNTDPFRFNGGHSLYVGEDGVPIRWLLAHLLYTLHSRLPAIPDSLGLRPDIQCYMHNMQKPEIMWSLFPCTQPALE